jgi:hypothetical protein
MYDEPQIAESKSSNGRWERLTRRTLSPERPLARAAKDAERARQGLRDEEPREHDARSREAAHREEEQNAPARPAQIVKKRDPNKNLRRRNGREEGNPRTHRSPHAAEAIGAVCDLRYGFGKILLRRLSIRFIIEP